jgi:hypothetical protein
MVIFCHEETKKQYDGDGNYWPRGTWENDGTYYLQAWMNMGIKA